MWRTPSYCDTPVGLNNSWDILTFASNIRLVQEVRLMTLPTEEVSKCCWANYLLKSPQVAGIAAHQPKVIWRWNTKSVTAPTAEVSNCKHKLISFTLTYSQVDTFHIWWVIWLDCVKPGILSALDSEKNAFWNKMRGTSAWYCTYPNTRLSRCSRVASFTSFSLLEHGESEHECVKTIQWVLSADLGRQLSTIVFPSSTSNTQHVLCFTCYYNQNCFLQE